MAGGTATVVLYVFLQMLVGVGLIPPVFRLDEAAVDLLVAALDLLPRIAWPAVVLAVVLLFSDEVRALIQELESAEGPGFRYRRRQKEKTVEAVEIQEDREALQKKQKTFTGAEGVTVGPVADESTLSKEKLETALAQLDKRAAQLYGPIADTLGDVQHAILLCLRDQPHPTNAKLKAGLLISSEDLHLAYKTLRLQGLIFKEGPGVAYRPTELGRSYLDWLKRARPDTFKRAASRYSGED